MIKIKTLLIVCCAFLPTFLLIAFMSPDSTNNSRRGVLDSRTLDVDRAFPDVQEGNPTNVYVRDSSEPQFLQHEETSVADRSSVQEERGRSEVVKENVVKENVVKENVVKENVVKENVDAKNYENVWSSEGLKSIEKEKYAFLAAVSDCAGVASLNFPENDVEDLKARLIEIGFREENIFILRSGGENAEQPTKEHIEERCRLLLSRVQDGDFVLVYLSGYGLQLDGSDASYFAPVDVDLKDIPNTSVSIDETMKLLAESRAEFRLMFVDAWRSDPNNTSGVFADNAPGVKGLTSVENVPSSISLLQSCQPGAVSYEGGGSKDSSVHNGIFMLALLEALGEDGKGDQNRDGVVSFFEICQYVTKRANVLANYYRNAEQVPAISGKITDFAFLEGLRTGEATKLFQEACDLRRHKQNEAALEKMRLACQKDPENQVYAEMKEMLEALVNATSTTPGSPDGDSFVVDTPDSSSSWTGDFEAGTRKTLTVNGVEFAFRYCPAGSFTMGSPLNESGRENDEIQRSVTISEGFWICETETTQAQWEAVGIEKAWKCKFKGTNLPVEYVSWYECDAFVRKLNELGLVPNDRRFVLPTEEQWEYACRAGTTGATYGVPLDEAAWYDENLYSGSTHEVGTKKPNKWGVFDMLGNVWEWTSSKSDDSSSFVERGGSWISLAQFCRPAVRGRDDPIGSSNLGFRCAIVRR